MEKDKRNSGAMVVVTILVMMTGATDHLVRKSLRGR